MEVILAKIVSLVCLLALALTFGTLPYCIVLRQSGCNILSARREKIIQFFNCFAGGVFIGALFLELLTEGAEVFEQYKENIGYESDFPFFNVIVITGFFFTSTVEHFAHSMLASGQQPSLRHVVKTSEKEESQCLHKEKSKGYGALDEDTSGMTPPEKLTSDAYHSTEPTRSIPFENGMIESSENNVSFKSKERNLMLSGVSAKSISTNRTLNIRSILLLLALSFHSVFDGLALGLQDTVPKVWQIFAAVAIHKCIVAFCLGLDVFLNFSDPKIAVLWMVIFSLVSPIGVSVGISLTSTGINETAQLLSSSIIQGLACGAFLYVSFLEILNSAWKTGHQRSFLNIICSFIGFIVMVFAKLND